MHSLLHQNEISSLVHVQKFQHRASRRVLLGRLNWKEITLLRNVCDELALVGEDRRDRCASSFGVNVVEDTDMVLLEDLVKLVS
jgi:hypothetical protein